jgi:hypothetical protein
LASAGGGARPRPPCLRGRRPRKGHHAAGSPHTNAHTASPAPHSLPAGFPPRTSPCCPLRPRTSHRGTPRSLGSRTTLRVRRALRGGQRHARRWRRGGWQQRAAWLPHEHSQPRADSRARAFPLSTRPAAIWTFASADAFSAYGVSAGPPPCPIPSLQGGHCDAFGSCMQATAQATVVITARYRRPYLFPVTTPAPAHHPTSAPAPLSPTPQSTPAEVEACQQQQGGVEGAAHCQQGQHHRARLNPQPCSLPWSARHAPNSTHGAPRPAAPAFYRRANPTPGCQLRACSRLLRAPPSPSAMPRVSRRTPAHLQPERRRSA